MSGRNDAEVANGPHVTLTLSDREVRLVLAALRFLSDRASESNRPPVDELANAIEQIAWRQRGDSFQTRLDKPSNDRR